ncbi:MAG: glycosyltransferase family 4 protein [Vicinamibacterales bacterium]|nr:glycosyltransferase family 4 protein [Vicinamibacterales bacterium]
MTALRGVTRLLLLTPGVGGADGISTLSRQYVQALSALARDAGATLEVWSLADSARPDVLPRETAFSGAGGRRWRFAARSLTAAGIGRHTRVIVLHAHLLPVTLPLRLRGARVVAVLIGVEVWGPIGHAVRCALRRAWRVLAISRATRDRFRDAHPELAGLEVRVCEPAAPVAWEMRSDVPAPAEPWPPGPTALIVGRMAVDERYKGHDALIEVWPEVRAQVPDATLLVVGTGDDEVRLRQKANALAGAGVRFTGMLPPARLAAAYRESAFFAMPSSGEGFGLVYLEAMQMGKACLAAPGAAEEVVEDGVSGVIVDPADRPALVLALVRLFTDVGWRDALGVAGRRIVQARFTPAHLAARLGASLEV